MIKKRGRPSKLRLVAVGPSTNTNLAQELEDSQNRHIAEVSSHDKTKLELQHKSAQLDAATLEIIMLKNKVESLFWALNMAMSR